MSKRPTRYRPKGEGWHTFFDYGGAAGWMRRNRRPAWDGDDNLTIVVYLGWGSHRDGIWTLECNLNAPIIFEILDKPARVGWIESTKETEKEYLKYWGVASYVRLPVPLGEPRRRPKERRMGLWKEPSPAKRRRAPERSTWVRVQRRKRPRVVRYWDDDRLPRKFR